MALQEEDIKQIREVIKEELSDMFGIDRIIFNKNIQVLDARNFQFGRTSGTKIGTEGGSSGQKIGLWGTTPVTQPSAIADPSGGGTQDAQARTAINDLIDKLQAIGIIQT